MTLDRIKFKRRITINQHQKFSRRKYTNVLNTCDVIEFNFMLIYKTDI